MKKIFFLPAFLFILTLYGCQQTNNPLIIIVPPTEVAPTTPDTPSSPDNPTTPNNPTSPENPTTPENTPTGGNDIIINASNLVFIEQGNETVDSTEYLVKKYADVFLEDPYFYTYYKVYYLNDKVRRVYSCDHGVGSQRDYKYSEFNEIECRKGHQTEDYIYFENGKKEKEIIINYDISGNITGQQTTTYYDSGNKKEYESRFPNTCSFQTFYDQPYDINIDNMSTTNGGGGLLKLLSSWSQDQVSLFLYYYESGYLKYFYSSGYYYEYEDNQTTVLSLDSSVYTSRTAYTNDQALAKLNELKNY